MGRRARHLRAAATDHDHRLGELLLEPVLARGAPGVILPLVWSVNIPIVNGAWIRLLEQLVGPTGLTPDDLAARIYSRAYFNMGALGGVFDTLGVPRESLEILSGIEGADGHMPRPRLNAQDPAPAAPRHRLRRAHPRLRAQGHRGPRLAGAAVRRVARLASRSRRPSAAEILAALDRLRPIVEQTAYLNVLTPLLSEAYNHLLARRLKRHGIAYDSVDFANRDPGDEGRDPTAALDALRRERATRSTAEALERARLRRRGRAPLARRRRRASCAASTGSSDRYGHFSDSGNDFSHVPWREDPDVVARMIAAIRRRPRLGTATHRR